MINPHCFRPFVLQRYLFVADAVINHQSTLHAKSFQSHKFPEKFEAQGKKKV
jgi:hypothetical protein